jgi:UDP-galactopyranose mutase
LDHLWAKEKAQEIETTLLQEFGDQQRVPVLKMTQHSHPLIKEFGSWLWASAFVGYSTKQWGFDPEKLSSSVTARVPFFTSRHGSYFSDPFQGLPLHGYTRWFEALLDHPNIETRCNSPMSSLLEPQTPQGYLLQGQPFKGWVVYTGPLDAFFHYQFGPLPYRSLRFEHEDLPVSQFQSYAVINYPGKEPYTRITEYKHMTQQPHRHTVITREFPEAFTINRNEPYYPIPQEDAEALARIYRSESAKREKTVFLGRLAEYRYYDMDACIARALKLHDTIFGDIRC